MSKISGRIRSVGTVGGNIRETSGMSGSINRPKTVYVKELHFSTHYEFPSIGDENKLYIATDENAQYRYDATDHAYHCVGRDPEDIDTIQIRLKEDI